jgi:thiamine-phosphate pyrophosphorylase
MPLPPLYPIIDFLSFARQPDPVWAIVRYAEELMSAGATLIQLRDKSLFHPGESNATRRFLSCARELRRVTLGKATLIINDRVDLCLASDADGVHLGQDDLSPEAARKIFDSTYPVSQSLGNGQLLQERMGHPGSFDRSFDPEKKLGDLEKTGLEGESFETRKSARKLLIGFSTHNLAQVREADTFSVDYIAIGPVFATGSKANPDPVVGVDGVRQARQATSKPLVAIGGITRLNCRQVKEAGADSVAVISDLLESPGKAVADFLRVLG